MRAFILALACSFGACEAPAEEPSARRLGSERVGREVVATVDGVGITLGDLRRVRASTGVAPREALRLLEDKELLAAHAERGGYGAGVSVRRVARRAAVQRVLGGVERGVDEEISEEEIQGVWAASFSETVPEINEGERERVKATVLVQRRLHDVGALLRTIEEDVFVERENAAIERLLRADLEDGRAP